VSSFGDLHFAQALFRI